jgi:hypothetical protein
MGNGRMSMFWSVSYEYEYGYSVSFLGTEEMVWDGVQVLILPVLVLVPVEEWES